MLPLYFLVGVPMHPENNQNPKLYKMLTAKYTLSYVKGTESNQIWVLQSHFSLICRSIS